MHIMKIFADCRMIDSGGIGTYLESILPYIVKKNDCTLMCTISQSKKLEKYKARVTIIITDIKTFSCHETFFFPYKIRKIINSCDIYYSPYCNVPSGIKIPLFTTIHDIVFLDVSGLSSKTGTLARKFFYQRAIRRSEAVFTVSRFSSERIKEKLKTGRTPIVITYNSAPEWFTNQQHIDSEQALQSNKDNSIIFVGNIKKHKGLSVLLDAFMLCKKKGLDARLIIIGNAENFRSGDKETVSKIVSLQSCTDNQKDIFFTGKITDTDLMEYYKKARLLVQPSLYEGFGMPPMEALASGTNVILSDIPVFREIYSDFPVTFFKSQDADDLAEKILIKFKSNPPERIPEKYSFKKTSDIIIKTFEETMTERIVDKKQNYIQREK